MDKCLSKFNATLIELLNDIKTVYPDLNTSIDLFIENYNLTNENSKDYFDYFVKKVYSNSKLIVEKDVTLFDNMNILDNVDIQFIFNNDENIANREIIWKYLNALYIYVHKYLELVHEMSKALENPDIIVKQLKEMGFDEKYFADQSHILNQMVENIQSKADEAIKNGEEPNPEDFKQNMPPEMEKMADSLFSGMIGNLAKEIATEIDPSTLNFDPENPQAILQSLLSGENSNLMSLVQNISGKIQIKMESGQIDQQALFSEAAAIMQNLQNMPGMPANMGAGLDPNMMMGMMTNMMMGATKKKDNTKNLTLLPKNHPKRRGGNK
jgi:hypothetical protein